MATFELFPGYTVEALPETPGAIGFAYKVTGPRKDWKLMRNQINPHMLFAVPENILKGTGKINGYEWFSDRSGTLKPCK